LRIVGCKFHDAWLASPGSDAAAQEVMRRKIAGGSDAAAQEATKLAEKKWDHYLLASNLRWPVRLRLASLCFAKASSDFVG